MSSAHICAHGKCFDVNVDVSSVIDRSEALIATGRHDRAIAVVTEALAKAPESAILHGVHSRVLSAAGLWPAALHAARRGIELEPHEPLSWCWLAHSFAGCNDLPAAESAARNSVDLSGGEWAEGLHILACSLLDQGGAERLLEAERIMLKVIELSPQDANYRYSRARVAAELGKHDDAGIHVQAGLAIDPLHTDLLLMHAGGAVRPSTERIRSLVGLLHLDPHKSEAQANLAAEYWRVNERVQMSWWILCVFDSILMMFIPQAPYAVFVMITWLALIPLLWINRPTRRALPKGYARRMRRRYPAAAWAARIAIAAGVSTPVVTIAFYGENGEAFMNVVVSALLLVAATSYAAFRWLASRACEFLSLEESATEVVSATMVLLVFGAVLAWRGGVGPQPAAVGIFLMTSSLGCVWWWAQATFAVQKSRFLKQSTPGPGPVAAITAVFLLLLLLIVVGTVVALAHGFVLIPLGS
jgi:Flp pilus assembly protein TadD